MSYWDKYDDRNREANCRGRRDAEWGYRSHESDYVFDFGSERREAYEDGYREVRREQERREERRQEEEAAERHAEQRRIEARRIEEAIEWEQAQYEQQPEPEQPEPEQEEV